MKSKIVNIFWLLTIIGAFISIFMLFITLTQSNGAPQEAAGAALSLCFVVIPYVMARSVEKIEFSKTEFRFKKLFWIFYSAWVVGNLFLFLNYYKFTADKQSMFIPFEKRPTDTISWDYYDWTELVAYIGIPLVVYLIISLVTKDNKKEKIEN